MATLGRIVPFKAGLGFVVGQELRRRTRRRWGPCWKLIHALGSSGRRGGVSGEWYLRARAQKGLTVRKRSVFRKEATMGKCVLKDD